MMPDFWVRAQAERDALKQQLAAVQAERDSLRLLAGELAQAMYLAPSCVSCGGVGNREGVGPCRYCRVQREALAHAREAGLL